VRLAIPDMRWTKLSAVRSPARVPEPADHARQDLLRVDAIAIVCEQLDLGRRVTERKDPREDVQSARTPVALLTSRARAGRVPG